MKVNKMLDVKKKVLEDIQAGRMKGDNEMIRYHKLYRYHLLTAIKNNTPVLTTVETRNMVNKLIEEGYIKIN